MVPEYLCLQFASTSTLLWQQGCNMENAVIMYWNTFLCLNHSGYQMCVDRSNMASAGTCSWQVINPAYRP
jgi:hypothetical protein